MPLNPRSSRLEQMLCIAVRSLPFLVCAPVLGFMLYPSEEAEAACLETGINVIGIHAAPNPIALEPDPDWQSLLEARAAEAVRSGEWAERMKAHEAALTKWAEAPVMPFRRGMVRTAVDVTKPTGFSARSLDASPFPEGTWSNFSRLYLFVDADSDVQVRFAERFAAALPDGTALRPVAAGGRPALLSERLSMRSWADQGGVLMRRLAIPALPAVVRLTPETVRIHVPALDAEGVPDEPIPSDLLSVSSLGSSR